MRIAYILPSLRNQGPIIVVRNLVTFLLEWGCEIDVFYFDDFPSAMCFNCPVKKISMKTLIDFDNYDIIHSHCLRPDKYIVKWRKNIHRAKIITTLHQDTYMSFRYQYNFLLSHIFTWYWCQLQSHFDGVISISNQLNSAYKHRIHTEITTIYNGCAIKIDESVDNYIVDTLLEIKKRYKLLGAYAFVTRRKGLEQILEALLALPDYAFAIIGEGPDVTRLKILSEKKGISDRVLFFPYQKNPCNYLPYFDVYVMPSYSEGFGLSMVEAALAKKGIVCSDIPSFREIFSGHEAGFFKLNNINSLRCTIVSTYQNRLTLGELAYERATKLFISQKMAENHLKYYKHIIQL